MDNKDELQEFDLDEILSEFHDDAQSAPSQAADEDLEELLGDLPDLDLSDEEAPESEEGSPQSPVQEDADPDSQPHASGVLAIYLLAARRRAAQAGTLGTGYREAGEGECAGARPPRQGRDERTPL